MGVEVDLLHHLFERLDRNRFDLLASRFGGDGDGLLGEGVDAFPLFGGWFLYCLELEQPWDGHLARATAPNQLLGNQLGQRFEHTPHVLL